MRRILALLSVFVLAGCTVFSSPTEPPPNPPEREVLRVGVGNAIDTAPLRIAVAAGEFNRAGLRVELVELQSADDGLAKLAAGDVDITFATDVALFRAAASGTALQLQGEAYTAGSDTMALVTLPDSDYQEPTAKSDPTIAVEVPNDLGSVAGRSVLATAGVDASKINFVQAPANELLNTVRDGTADAAWMVEPAITTARKEYGARIITDGAIGATKDFPVSGYAAATTFANTNPNTLALFRSTLGKAQLRADDPAVVRQALPALAEIDTTTAALIALGSYPSSLNAVRLQRVADLMHAAGDIPARLDVQTMLPPVTSD